LVCPKISRLLVTTDMKHLLAPVLLPESQPPREPKALRKKRGHGVSASGERQTVHSHSEIKMCTQHSVNGSRSPKETRATHTNEPGGWDHEQSPSKLHSLKALSGHCRNRVEMRTS
jgi:hypothetical protein